MSVDPQDQEASVELRDRLLAQQSIAGTFLGSIAGAVPGFALYLAIISANVVPIIAYVIPGVAVGLGARFVGRGIDSVHTWIAAAVVVTGIGLCQAYLGFQAFEAAFSLLNAALAGYFAKRSLTLEQDKALYRYKRGLPEPTATRDDINAA